MADASPIYYMYSTIAQTMAAAGGFLAAIGTYRLQQLGNDIERLGCPQIAAGTVDDARAAELEQAWKRRDYRRAADLIRGSDDGKFAEFDGLARDYHKLRSWLAASLYATGSAVLIALLALCFGQQLIGFDPISLLAGWLITLVCFLFYVEVVLSLRVGSRGKQQDGPLAWLVDMVKRLAKRGSTRRPIESTPTSAAPAQVGAARKNQPEGPRERSG